jgi:hypothetical protein
MPDRSRTSCRMVMTSCFPDRSPVAAEAIEKRSCSLDCGILKDSLTKTLLSLSARQCDPPSRSNHTLAFGYLGASRIVKERQKRRQWRRNLAVACSTSVVQATTSLYSRGTPIVNGPEVFFGKKSPSTKRARTFRSLPVDLLGVAPPARHGRRSAVIMPATSFEVNEKMQLTLIRRKNAGP